MIDYRAAWFRGWNEHPHKTLDECPFDNAGEAKMWRAGWWYRRVHGDRRPS